LKLRLPPGNQFRYLPGQHIDLIYRDIRRSYSIANIQPTYYGIELHIRRIVNGLFSNVVFGAIKLGQLLRFEGPFGTFFCRKGNSRIILIAGGTGFAPIKAIVEQLIFERSDREINVYWGSRTIDGFYSDLPHRWQLEYSNISYTPVLSSQDQDWKGRSGLVHKAVLEDFEDVSSYDVYVCGSPQMIAAARSDFIAEGLEPKRFYYDAFTASI
jgi:CDP-4-dehydro-6-deoxyglucose reductase